MRPAFEVPSTFPPGYTEEYKGNTVRNVAIAFVVLEVAFVSLRAISRRLAMKKLGVDDLLVMLGFVFCLALDIAVIVQIAKARLGYHTSVIIVEYPDAFVLLQKIAVVLPILWSFACAFPRLSILTMYLRIFVDRWQIIGCYLVMAAVVAEALVCITLDVIQCIPLSLVWDPTGDGHCFDVASFYRWAPVPNMFIDLAMLVLPLPTIWELSTSGQVKLGLAVTFFTGSIGLVTAIMRTVTFFRHDYNDPNSWAIVVYILWSIIEPGVYLIAACLPSFRPLINLALTGSSTGTPFANKASNKHRMYEFERNIDANLLTFVSEEELETPRRKSFGSSINGQRPVDMKSWPLRD